MPVAVFVLGVAAGLEVMSCRMLLIMSVISFGVLVASYGELSISWVGVVYQMGGVVGEALRLIFMEIFVKRKGLKLNPISVMYYVSPCRYYLSLILYMCSIMSLKAFLSILKCNFLNFCCGFTVLFAYLFHGSFWRNQRWMPLGHGTFHLLC